MKSNTYSKRLLPGSIVATFALILLLPGCDSLKPELHEYGFDPHQFCAANNPAATDLEKASTARKASLDLQPKLWWDKDNLWPKDKKTLKVYFIDGEERVQKKVFAAAEEWTVDCGIKFIRVNTPDADIRITFNSIGHRSLIGKKCAVNKNAPSMFLGLTRRHANSEVRRVALHEFGHALGMQHEAQHPQGNIKWKNEAQLKAFYWSQFSMSAAEVQSQILNAVSYSNFGGSDIDRNSIMMYPIPKGVAENFESGWNKKLSAADLVWISHAYPRTPLIVPGSP